MTSEPLSVREALRRAQEALGSDAPAKRLLADCLEQSWGWVSLNHDRVLDATQQNRLANWLDRAATGEPLAYITGRTGFWTLELHITPDVLIPRPATETLVEQALRLSGDNVQSVLDLGTGSGAVALALASERPRWDITASDRDPAALAVARRNSESCDLPHLQFACGDWFDAVQNCRFDGIVCNPPYIADADSAVDDSVRKHEPAAALFSGTDGLNDLRQVIGAAPQLLQPGGWLAVEHGYLQASPVQQLFTEAGFIQLQTVEDLEGHPRVTSGRLPDEPE